MDSRDAAPCRLFVFAKEPEPGQVKTRLTPPLTPAQAARCHRAFVSDTIAWVGLATPVTSTAIAAAPAGPKPWLAGLAAEHGLELVEQGEGGLGARMAKILASATASGGSCILIGADTPDLPPAYLSEAIERLRGSRVVIGPASDGGYYLFGARGVVPPVFDLEAEWGGSAVFAETQDRLKAAGLGCEVLGAWRDVDRYDDLKALASRLRTAQTRARASTEVLSELVAEGLTL